MTPREMAQKVYDKAFEGAASIVASGQEHAPIIFCLTADGGGGVFPAYMLDKDAIAEAHRRLASDPRVACACLIMEAWVHTGRGDDRVAQAIVDGKIAVSDTPLRKEAVVFNVRAKGEQYLACCLIDRAKGALAKDALRDVNGEGADGWRGEGRFVG